MSQVNHLWLSLIRSANRRTRNNRTIRNLGIGIYRSAVRAHRFLPPPRVLLNGPPKSGTHLLSDCLSLMPQMMYSGRHFALTDFIAQEVDPVPSQAYPPLEEEGLASFLKKCPQGMFVTAHARAHPLLTALVEEVPFKHIFLLRDPRDIAVSHIYYVQREALHPQHTLFTRTLRDNDQRLLATIRNMKMEGSEGTPSRSAFDTLAGCLPWLDHPTTLVIRFEDLIGPQGGGDRDVQLATIRTIGDFVERPLLPSHAEAIAQKMYARTSSTFRKGRVGDWRNHFTQAHRDAFKDVMGERLIQFGYERDMNW